MFSKSDKTNAINPFTLIVSALAIGSAACAAAPSVEPHDGQPEVEIERQLELDAQRPVFGADSSISKLARSSSRKSDGAAGRSCFHHSFTSNARLRARGDTRSLTMRAEHAAQRSRYPRRPRDPHRFPPAMP